MIGYCDTFALIKLFIDETSRTCLRCTGWATQPVGHRHEYRYPCNRCDSRASHKTVIMLRYNFSSGSRAEIKTTGVVLGGILMDASLIVGLGRGCTRNQMNGLG